MVGVAQSNSTICAARNMQSCLHISRLFEQVLEPCPAGQKLPITTTSTRMDEISFQILVGHSREHGAQCLQVHSTKMAKQGGAGR